MTPRGKLVQKRIGVSLRSGQKRKRSSLKARRRKRKRPRSQAAFTQERGNVEVDRRADLVKELRETLFDQLETLAKRLADDLCKLSDVYEVTLDVAGEGRFATHTSTSAIHQTLLARRNESGRKVWRDTGQLQWTGVTFASKTDCSYVDLVIAATRWSATILDAGDGELQVTWTRDGNDSRTASVDCPGDPDRRRSPGQPGVALINTGPESFLVPYAGGTQAVSGEVSDGGDGFFNSGSITVKPAGVR